MPKDLLSFSESVAQSAKISKVQSVPTYSYSEVSEFLKQFDSIDVFEVESQTAALSSAIGTELAGKRTLVPLSVPSSLEELYKISDMGLPIVASSVSNNMSDVLAARDAGWLIFLAESSQELLDATVLAYKISEDRKVMLPSIVSANGLANMRESLEIPNDKTIDKFLTPLNIDNISSKKNKRFGVPTDDFETLRKEQQKSMENVEKMIPKLSEIWKKKFRRDFNVIEKYQMEDAENVIVAAGYNSPTIKTVVDKMRENGEKVGLVRIIMLRPFPEEQLREALSGAKKVAVIDDNITLGKTGILFSEVRHLHNDCSNFIILRGLQENDVKKVFSEMKTAEGVSYI